MAERGTVSAAAEALGYTAPAVSQQISKLEAHLGLTLFDRVGGRLRVSPDGESLIPVARQFLDVASQAERPQPATPRQERIVIAGFASAIRAVVLPLLTSKIARRMTFEVREDEDEIALRDLRLGQLDVAITQDYDGAPSDRSDRLTYTPLLKDRLRLIAPPSYAPSVTLAQLAPSGWLVNGSGTRCEEATTHVLRSAGIAPRITGHIADNHTLLALVVAGHGATIAPELVITGERADVTVAAKARSENLRISRTIYCVTRTAMNPNLGPVIAQLRIAGRTALRRQRDRRRRPGT